MNGILFITWLDTGIAVSIQDLVGSMEKRTDASQSGPHTVAARPMAPKIISLLGFAATTFPFGAPSGITTAGNVEKKKTPNEDSQYAVPNQSFAGG